MSLDPSNGFRQRRARSADAARQIPESRDHWALGYVKQNPLKVGAALATLYGLLIIFGYHFHIDYSPTFDIQSLGSLIFASAFVGMLILAGLSAGLFFPSYFIGMFCIDENVCRDKNTLAARILICFGIAWLAYVTLFATVFVLAKSDVAPEYLFLSFPVCYGLFAVFELGKRHISVTGAHGWSAYMRAIFAAAKSRLSLGLGITVACLLEFMPIVVYIPMLRDSPYFMNGQPAWGDILFLAVMSGLCIHVVGGYLVYAWCAKVLSQMHRLLSVAATLITPILVLFFAKEHSLIVAATVATTKIGNFRAAELTLSDDGCRIIAGVNGTLCVKTAAGTNKLCNVHIMSRLGKESYLLLSYPAIRRQTIQPGAQPGPVANSPQASSAAQEINQIQDVYLPSNAILGIKPDNSIRNFTKEAITSRLRMGTSGCEKLAPGTPLKPEMGTSSKSDVAQSRPGGSSGPAAP